ncbi:two-component system, chemotaxis family, response regulator CheB [Mariprofundus micogutta]|uniref:Protein-glutamate methylesterase/protein-glutamine glutaminase n=1 Tax=Mariprofundus micogutta TaxID=1921010 RepID=A0A1L8CNN3_9PROT|nr:chemotaxis-specific protein-glutamate methyltransferase CheB [Mariprofundus micogutta]GAV20530.1 two-component system, chemotaxis family, response regulator CheB [Mariprofundus micogutta]
MIRLLLVDDSKLYRRLLARALSGCNDIEIVGEAVDGQDALEKITRLKPDVITLDMNMPRMNGMETLAVLSVQHPAVKTIIVAAETRDDAERSVLALEAGAFGVVLKPKASESAPVKALTDELGPKVRAAAGRMQSMPGKTVIRRPRKSINRFTPDIIAIGSSTGGPAALHDVLTVVKADIPCPVVVVQHMPKLFVESLARRLDRDTRLNCCVAEDGTCLQAGQIYFAPGEAHLMVERNATGQLIARLNDGPAEHHCKPAVDVTLRSLHKLADRTHALVVILTGMGADGAAGAAALSKSGASVIAQDKESSVVWGMPGETVKLGAADEVLPLQQIGDAINRIALGLSK